MDQLAFTPITFNHANAGLVAGTGSSYTTTAATICSIGGKFATSLAAQTNTASPTVDAVTGLAFVPVLLNQACMLVWGVNLAGQIRLVQGASVPTEPGVTTTVGAFLQAPFVPGLPDDFCPIAYQIVRVSPTGATFTPGTTAWAASGITCSVARNISCLPGRPPAGLPACRPQSSVVMKMNAQSSNTAKQHEGGCP